MIGGDMRRLSRASDVADRIDAAIARSEPGIDHHPARARFDARGVQTKIGDVRFAPDGNELKLKPEGLPALPDNIPVLQPQWGE